MRHMTLLERLKDQVIADEFNSLYDIWEGCYTDDEYDFKVRHNLSQRFPETSWVNPEHENMLLGMAIHSHVLDWKQEYLRGGWTREGFCLDGLRNLFIYYGVWQEIINNCGGNNDQ